MITADDYEICETQGKIFEYAVSNNYNLKVFAEKYMQSKFCNNEMDSVYSRFHFAYYKEAVWTFFPEIEESLELSNGVNEDGVFAEDIGFMYRLLHILSSVPSKALFHRVPFEYIIKESYNFQHYGFENCAYEIMEEYSLPNRRYDKDIVLLSDEEAKILKAEFEDKYVKRFIGKGRS